MTPWLPHTERSAPSPQSWQHGLQSRCLEAAAHVSSEADNLHIAQRGRSTSHVVSDAGPEAAPPGYEDPLKDLSVYTTWLHDDDCRRVKETRSIYREPQITRDDITEHHI